MAALRTFRQLAMMIIGLTVMLGLPLPAESAAADARILAASAAPAALIAPAAPPPSFAEVRPGTPLVFPCDHGAHPGFRTEWWYVTGWLQTPDRQPLGFQVTFFRSATAHDRRNPSRFAPTQLIIAHVALSDPAQGRLQHDEKIARAGFGLAHAAAADTDLKLGAWTMQRTVAGGYELNIPAREFRLRLTLAPTQPLMLQGAAGYSRKGPKPAQASHYYSLPQLNVSGEITRQGKAVPVSGDAWLDHEWSSTVLDSQAVGWDWAGLNLDDGSALMAFRIRDAKGATLWSHAALRDAQGRQRSFGSGSDEGGQRNSRGSRSSSSSTSNSSSSVKFTPLRQWRSPRTGASYPVGMAIDAAGARWQLAPLQDDQELDSRKSTGSVYWEGAVRVLRDGQPVGHGYLEMTGYVQALKL